MSSFVSFYVLCLMHSLVRSDDICSVLKPEGDYRGVNVYAYPNGSVTDYWMNNRNGIEWKLNISANGRLYADSTSIRDIEPNIIDRMVFSMNKNRMILKIYCDVIAAQDRRQKRMICKTINSTTFANQTFEWNSTGISIFFGPFRILDGPTVHTLYYDVDRKDRTKQFVIGFADSLTIYRNQCKPNECLKSGHYLYGINDRLDTKLDAILFTQSSDILFFNIDQTLKYCIQSKDSGLSPKCNSSKLMRTAFKHCFTSVEELPNYLTISVICVIVLIASLITILVAIVCVIIRKSSTKPVNKYVAKRVPPKQQKN